MDKVKVGIIGCGNISGIYLKNLSSMFEITEIAACADAIPERAVKKAEEHNIREACSVAELLANPEIRIALNLTTPASHAEVSLAALEAGKNVYVEKPLAVTREDGRKIIKLAKEKGLLIGCAPDTFLGGGIQTCRKLIDDGWIGRPVAATAFMLCHGTMKGGIPTRNFTTRPAGGRCSIWVRIILPRLYRCWVRYQGLQAPQKLPSPNGLSQAHLNTVKKLMWRSQRT